MPLGHDELSDTQLKEHGRQLSHIIYAKNADTPMELAQIVKSVIRDLFPENDEIHGALADACLSLVKISKASEGIPKEILMVNLKERLHRTYNSNVVNQVIVFAEGFLGDASGSIEHAHRDQPESVAERSTQPKNSVTAIELNSNCSTNANTGIKKIDVNVIIAGSFLVTMIAVGMLATVTLLVLKGGNRNPKENTIAERPNDSTKISSVDKNSSGIASGTGQSSSVGKNPPYEGNEYTSNNAPSANDFYEGAVISQITQWTPPGLRIATAVLTYNDGDVLSGKFRIYCPTSEIRPIDYELKSSNGIVKKSGSWWEESFAPRYNAEKILVQKTCAQ